MAADHALLVFVVLSAIGMIVLWRREESHLLLGAIVGIALYNITNGTSTSFRYAIPGLVFYALAVALLVSRTAPRLTSTSRARGMRRPTAASQ
jgi:hypothetical protein